MSTVDVYYYYNLELTSSFFSKTVTWIHLFKMKTGLCQTVLSIRIMHWFKCVLHIFLHYIERSMYEQQQRIKRKKTFTFGCSQKSLQANFIKNGSSDNSGTHSLKVRWQCLRQQTAICSMAQLDTCTFTSSGLFLTTVLLHYLVSEIAFCHK